MLITIIFICALYCSGIYFHQMLTMVVQYIGYSMRTLEERQKHLMPYKDTSVHGRRIMALLMSIFWGIFYYLTH